MSTSSTLQTAPPRVAVLIPTYEPTRTLIHLVDRLTEAETPAILVVDDGSSAARQWVLTRIALNPAVHLLRHSRSRGKGVALKTGMGYFLEYLSHYTGLVTADGDGKHRADDIIRVARALNKAPRLAILGARSFDGAVSSYPGIQRRVIAANRILAFLFRAFTGIPLSDAQTGMRGLPTALLPSLLALPGSRYEYEMAVLLHIARSGHPLAEQPIRMLRGAPDTDLDFRPVLDSWRVVRTLLSPHQSGASNPEAATIEAVEKPEGAKSPGTLHVR